MTSKCPYAMSRYYYKYCLYDKMHGCFSSFILAKLFHDQNKNGYEAFIYFQICFSIIDILGGEQKDTYSSSSLLH